MLNFDIIYIAIAVASLYFLYEKFSTDRIRAAFAAKHGCKPAPTWNRNPLLNGLDIAMMFIKWTKNHEMTQGFTRALKDNGRIIISPYLGTIRGYTSDPEIAYAMVNGEEWDLSAVRIKAFEPYSKGFVTAVTGTEWAHGRALLRPVISKSQTSNFDMYEECFQKLRLLIPHDGSTVDLQALFYRFSMAVIASILFGEDLDFLNLESDGRAQEFAAAFDEVLFGIMMRCTKGKLIYIDRDPKFLQGCKIIRKNISQAVDRAIERKKLKGPENVGQESANRYVMVEALLQEGQDRKIIETQAAGIISGGRNTTAQLLSNIFWLLVRHPAQLAALREEIKSLEGKPPTPDQIQKMTYLQWVIDETLRLMPSVVWIERAATRDTTLPRGGGPDHKSPIFIKKGTVIAINTWVMHRDTDIWGPDAEEFRPERWKDLSKSDIRFRTFGGGPRTCPGRTLAIAESGYLTVRILQTYSVLENRDDRPWKEKMGLTVSMANGCQVSLGE